MTLQIVTLNVSITNPPQPSTLQRTGAFISQGGTSTAPGTLSLLTSSSSLTSILAAAKPITSAVWASGTVTVTTTTPHGWNTGDSFKVVIAGMTPTAYNGVFTATVTGASTFTYPLVSNPGSATVFGTVTDEDVTELTQMNTTFWAQGTGVSVYVLELGPGTPAEGIVYLNTWIQNNPKVVYSFLVPREWDAEPTFYPFVKNFNAPTVLQNFFVTTTQATYTNYGALDNCVFALVEAPAVASAANTGTEFSCAAPFYVTLNYNPSSTNQVPPLNCAFVYGVTAYPQQGNGTILQTFKTANVNYINTGAEGGLSNTIVQWGHMQDGNPFNYWYSVDWAIINIDLDLSNEIINGSNNVLSPLYYDQPGIQRLQNRAARTLSNGVSYGLILGSVIPVTLDPTTFAQNLNAGTYAGNAVINAVPFAIYTTANPSDYMLGQYNGLQAAVTPKRGFEQIIFNLNVTNFVG
jgi:hypothetical protein